MTTSLPPLLDLFVLIVALSGPSLALTLFALIWWRSKPSGEFTEQALISPLDHRRTSIPQTSLPNSQLARPLAPHITTFKLTDVTTR